MSYQEALKRLKLIDLDNINEEFWNTVSGNLNNLKEIKLWWNVVFGEIKPIIDSEQLIIFQNLVINMPVSDHVINFAVKFVRSTRLDNNSDKSIQKWLNWGAGPRASSILVLAAKANALMNDRTTPEIDDIKYVVKPVLRHRIIPNFNAEADGMSCDDILEYLLNSLE